MVSGSPRPGTVRIRVPLLPPHPRPGLQLQPPLSAERFRGKAQTHPPAAPRHVPGARATRGAEPPRKMLPESRGHEDAQMPGPPLSQLCLRPFLAAFPAPGGAGAGHRGGDGIQEQQRGKEEPPANPSWHQPCSILHLPPGVRQGPPGCLPSGFALTPHQRPKIESFPPRHRDALQPPFSTDPRRTRLLLPIPAQNRCLGSVPPWAPSRWSPTQVCPPPIPRTPFRLIPCPHRCR